VLEVGIVLQVPTPSALPHTWTLKWVYKELGGATNVDFIMLAIYVNDGIMVNLKLKLSPKLKIILVKEFDTIYEGEINSCVGPHII
jgi:hypothetical protein